MQFSQMIHRPFNPITDLSCLRPFLCPQRAQQITSLLRFGAGQTPWMRNLTDAMPCLAMGTRDVSRPRPERSTHHRQYHRNCMVSCHQSSPIPFHNFFETFKSLSSPSTQMMSSSLRAFSMQSMLTFSRSRVHHQALFHPRDHSLRTECEKLVE